MLEIHKYHAMGNDMLVIDPATFSAELTPDLIRRLCHRNFGVGADGICYGPLPAAKPNLTMRFFNPDGSEAEKSGNGLRIFARYLWDAGYVNGPAIPGPAIPGSARYSPFTMYINNEPILTTIEDDTATTITTALGRLSFSTPLAPDSLREILGVLLTPNEIAAGATAVNIGNPHCVLFIESVTAERARQIGPLLETADPFPNRTNVQLVQVIDPHTIQIEIWERGAGYTLASGTSATAAAGAAIYTHRCQSPVRVQMAGGSAAVTVSGDWSAALTGTVQPVFSGVLAQSFLLS
ncbi:MAG: diaminopimelate epimerase [Candidatus Promineifilaceae bacterium]